MVPIVIAHGNCSDGFTSAWACWLKNPTWEYYHATHGNPPPDVTGREVYMLDFSYKKPVLLELAAKAKSIIILDHHKTALEDLEDHGCENVHVFFDLNKSGARLTWEYFHHDEEVPELVKFVEDRDLWRFSILYSREVNAAVFSYEYTFENWNKLHKLCENRLELIINEGRAIERKHQKDVAELVNATKRKMTIGGTEVWVANLPYTLTSDAGHLMCDDDKSFGCCYWDTPEGRTFSLRSKNDGPDVSEIAKLYGGGGHPHAAGFRLPHGVQP